MILHESAFKKWVVFTFYYSWGHIVLRKLWKFLIFRKVGGGARMNFYEGDHLLGTYATFSEKLTFLTPDTHTYVCVSGG